METSAKVAIIGAGLTGLTTAFYLKKAGIRFCVFEKENREGGVIQTVSEDGFTYEKGPNSGVISFPDTVELLEELVSHCSIEIAAPSAKKRLVWKGKKWHELPSGLWGGISTPLFSWYDKFRILGEPFRPKGTDPNERLDQFVLRRLGRSFLDYAVDPFVLGIYAGDSSWLVPRFALPKLYNLEQKYGSFIGGSIKKAKEPKSERDQKATRDVFSIKGGLSNLINALQTEIGTENIRLNCDELTVGKEADGTYSVKNGDEDLGTFSKVVSTIGGHAVPHVLPFLAEEKVKKITCMKYAKVVQFSVGFRQWKGIPVNAFGGLVPWKEQRGLLGVLYLSTSFSGRAPEGGALFSVFMGGLRKPEIYNMPENELFEILTREFTAMMGLEHFNPDLLKIHRYAHAIPQYGPESEEKLGAIAELENEHPGLLLAGNVRNGIGMSDRIKQGKEIAEKIRITI
ncbi:MAG: protoporphyrinogen oxidase [Prolixibacteraceae bacterium]|jgi:oxygen-dependent protoporphyrinogen oxidase|nr:protoporphyrinogen oxidase [Prolixibacteraceae bacterium]